MTEPMSGRWVCRRCYESNDADVTACGRCGLERGADPTQATDAAGTRDEPQPWAAATPAAPQGSPWLALLGRFGWIAVVVIIAAVGIFLNARRDDSGQISNAGNLGVADLRIGDCFTLKDESADTVEEVDAKPCGEAHAYELFHAADMSGGTYPSDADFTAFIDQQCVPQFGTYVGLSYVESQLELGSFTPTTGAWDDGDHNVQCVLYDPSGELLVGSMRNAAR